MRAAGTWDESAQTVTDTICPYCGVGCSLDLHVQDDEIVKVTSPLDSTRHRGPPLHQGPLRLRVRQRAPGPSEPDAERVGRRNGRPTLLASLSSRGHLAAAMPEPTAARTMLTTWIVPSLRSTYRLARSSNRMNAMKRPSGDHDVPKSSVGPPTTTC